MGASLSEKFKRSGEIVAYFWELRILKSSVYNNSGVDSFAELERVIR